MSTPLPSARPRLLDRRGLGPLLLARVVSDAGDWLLMIALPVYVFELTGSTLATSAVFFAELAPALLLGSLAGVLVDRWDRRHTLIGANCAQAALLLPLLAVDRPSRLWLVVTVAVTQSALARLAAPAAFALLPAVLPADSLARANSLLGVADAVARLAGAPLGGLIYAAGGLPTVVAADAGTFLAAAALAALIRPGAGAAPAAAVRAGEPAARAVGLRAGWVDGLRLVARSRALSGLLGATGLSQVAQGLFLVLFVVFVQRSLHGGGADVGLLRGVQAVGAVVGGLSLGLLARRVRPAAMFGYSLVVLGLLCLVVWNLPAATTSLGWYVALFALVGMPAVALVAGGRTVAQMALPASHLGRVAGLYDSVTSACGLLGVLLAGVLGGRLPLGVLLTGQAAIYLVAGLASLALLGPAVRAARPLPPSVPPAPAQSATG